ncbi:TrmH family RNA methyltransferase [Chryseosolibacter indicus]|uniref:RNA methyltransferase n=1 Tax=Chryseosolibacter indicus TaxID=2782351 RepID=A0ABS5VRN4_9BACT|nr:RNA methyltransferase [Chryseosolibacter indicus]MBT1703429.1 RNA methyltransferase [Chryseosolibacter indicus]
MLSKANVKLIKSLQLKKYRKQEQCFLVEGAKSVTELLSSEFEVVKLFGTSDFLSGIKNTGRIEVNEVSEKELDGLGEFQSNNTALAVARIKPNKSITIGTDEFGIALDNIRDPGNLGTIIRTADWYGIHKIIASHETADFYNPKVISATMGSFTRVSFQYVDIKEYLAGFGGSIYGAYLNGKNVHQTTFKKGGLILIGNESHGISPDLETLVTDKITIPRYGHAESLNAAIATAIICDNVRRNSD